MNTTFPQYSLSFVMPKATCLSYRQSRHKPRPYQIHHLQNRVHHLQLSHYEFQDTSSLAPQLFPQGLYSILLPNQQSLRLRKADYPTTLPSAFLFQNTDPA